MEGYRNKWNINMNTIGLADNNVRDVMKVFGFVTKQNGKTKSFIHTDEATCIRDWFNAHCLETESISEIYEELIQEQGAKIKEYVDKLSMLPLHAIPEMDSNILLGSEHLRYSMICNSLGRGLKTDIVTEEDVKHYGYGLVYWIANDAHFFFDNRMAVAFRKISELKNQGINPLCIRIKKIGNQPIPVAKGRTLLCGLVQEKNLKGDYDKLQKYNCI